jgi:ribosomal protein S27AE
MQDPEVEDLHKIRTRWKLVGAVPENWKIDIKKIREHALNLMDDSSVKTRGEISGYLDLMDSLAREYEKLFGIWQLDLDIIKKDINHAVIAKRSLKSLNNESSDFAKFILEFIDFLLESVTNIRRVCKKCGSIMPKRAKFCGKCGAELKWESI